MDEIEDTFQTACPSERQALINAMNALRELRRVSENSGSNGSRKPPRTSVVAGCESDISASHTLPSNRDRTTVKNSMMNAAYVDCPYCDGENIVAPVKSIGTAHDLSQREIACRHCQSLFFPSESKYGVHMRSVGESDAA